MPLVGVVFQKTFKIILMDYEIWAHAVEKNNPYILHFIHEGWRDEGLVSRILKASENAKKGG